MIFVARSLQVWPASQLPCLVCLTNCDETHQTFQPGREALAHPGRCPLAAVAVAGCRTLLPSRHAASPGLGCLRPAIAVSSAVAVVAAVRVQLSRHHRLVAPLNHHGGVAGIARRHRADACARSSRQVSARFRRTAGRTHHFPPAPHHCTAISAVAGAARTYISVPFVPTAANCRDRQRQQCAQRIQRPRCSAYRPRPAIWPRDFVRPKTSAIRREAPPVAEDGALTVRSAISAPPSFRRLHCGGRKQPTSLWQTNFV